MCTSRPDLSANLQTCKSTCCLDIFTWTSTVGISNPPSPKHNSFNRLLGVIKKYLQFWRYQNFGVIFKFPFSCISLKRQPTLLAVPSNYVKNLIPDNTFSLTLLVWNCLLSHWMIASDSLHLPLPFQPIPIAAFSIFRSCLSCVQNPTVVPHRISDMMLISVLKRLFLSLILLQPHYPPCCFGNRCGNKRSSLRAFAFVDPSVQNMPL